MQLQAGTRSEPITSSDLENTKERVGGSEATDVGNYFPKSLKVADRLRATFSRSITAGVASTFNAAVRRLQLAEGNLVALSLIPPMPDARRFSNTRSQLSKVYAGLNRVSAEQLPARFADIVSCDSFSRGPDGSRVQGHDS